MSGWVKPPLGASVARGHPLARALAGAWLFNEGRGGAVFDASGAGHTGTLISMDPPSDWVGGPHGYALDFDGVDDRVVVAAPAGIDLGTANAGVVRCRIWPSGWDILVGDQGLQDKGYLLALNSGNLQYGVVGASAAVGHGIGAGDEVWLGVSREGTQVTFYKNGVRLGTPQTLNANNPLAVSTVGAFYAGSGPTTMRCDYVYCWRRALSASEMAWLYRQAFGFVTRPIVLPIVVLPQGTIHEVSGTADAISGASADAAVIHAGELPTGRLWPNVTLGIEASWLRDALFHGTTDAGFQLGTVLTQGWFWTRQAGCTAVYRVEDPNLESRNPNSGFGSPVFVAPVDARQIRLPTYLSHEAGTACRYVVRRFNWCGQQDRTTLAATIVHIAPDGQLAAPVPNATFTLNGRQTAGSRLTLTWFYCPVDQEAAPHAFHIYWDGGTGEVDTVHPIATVPYEGRKFYRHDSQPLGGGTVRFAVQAETAAGAQGPPRKCTIRIANANISEGPDIVETEAI